MVISNINKTVLFLFIMFMQLIAQQNQNITNRRLARDKFKNKYGDQWIIRWNSKTETPSSIVGDKITRYKGSHIEIAKSFLNEEKVMLGINNVENELLFAKQNTSKRGGTRYIFSQVLNGIPVIGSGYNVAVSNDGAIYFVSGSFYPGVNCNTKPSLTPGSIIELIKKDLNTIHNLKFDNPQLSILPVELNSEFKYKLVFVTNIYSDKPRTALKYTIDANNGGIISKDELIDKINGTGKVYETNPNNGGTVLKTIHRLSDISPRKLDGDNAVVYNNDGDEASSSTATFEYLPDNTHFDEVMAYYHSDEFENWLITKGMGENQVGKFTIYTHDQTIYAGTYSPSRIMYLSDGESGLRNPSHEAAVICHEYMHGVSETYNSLDFIPGSGEEDAMDEAYSDYFGVAYSNQFINTSIIGAYIDEPGGYVYQRNLNNSWTMTDYNTIDLEPDSTIEEHDRSVIFSGALWNFRSNTNVVASEADELILESLNNLGYYSPTFLDGRDALIAADIATNNGCYVNIIKHSFFLKNIGADAESVTLNGTLANNETWYCTKTLQGNVFVPTNVTLTISSCATVNLGPYSIISTGGTINVQGTVNGLRAKTTSSNVVKGYHPTIQSAVNNCPAYNVVEIISGTIYENISASNKNNLTIAGAIDGSTFLNGTFTFNNCNNLFLVSATLKQLSANYCSPCTLWCNIEGDLSQAGLSLYACNLYNHKGDLYNCTTGLIANSTSGYVENSDIRHLIAIYMHLQVLILLLLIIGFAAV